MIAAGTLDRKITIERATTTLDDAGTPSETWATVATLRAALTTNAADEAIAGSGAVATTTLTFTTRFFDGLTLADRVTYDGTAYNLKEIIEIGRRRGLTLKCQKVGA